ncbi:MAG: hypothetical protein GX176_03275 [Syntrophomonadaceae bacterium]|jgi:hypothetical protein|nr:hypothetical protein [Bacillota bacterium]NLM87772.1 hypothetical protein [Syntrophomonadaceae bacterium]
MAGKYTGAGKSHVDPGFHGRPADEPEEPVFLPIDLTVLEKVEICHKSVVYFHTTW